MSSFPAITRVVTGHDADGQAVIAEAGPLPTSVALSAIPGTVFHEIWSTVGTPAPVDNGPDPTLGPLALSPPRHGTRIRIVDIGHIGVSLREELSKEILKPSAVSEHGVQVN